ncbi:hypothetical protein [Streptosporangium sandarakinum]|uniref:hypothetical protein n=1 Tax=Streptosporangium sandarakinum TaxID=1260955 RepID=UPI0037A61317
MVRWRSRLSKPVAVSMLGLLGGALVVLPSGQASANAAELVVDYQCTGNGPDSIAQSGPVRLRTRVSVPTTLTVGQPLNIGWKLGYLGNARFGSPGFFAPGAAVTATGTVALSGVWSGGLKPVGAVEQPRQLQPGTILKLPETISDFAHTDQAGTLKVTPRNIVLDFTPPAGEVMVNDDDPRVDYSGGGWKDLNDQPIQNNDYHYDLHRTEEKGDTASFTFTGTGIEYVAQRDYRAGKVRFYIDGEAATPAYVDASKKADGSPSTDAGKGGLTLWRFRGLSYGKHLVQVVNDEQGKWGQLDAFRVITKELAAPPKAHRVTCKIVSNPVSVNVVISDPSSTTPPPNTTPPTSPSPTEDPTNTPTGGPTTPSPPTCLPTNQPLVPTVTPTPTPTPTSTPTATPDPTATPTSTEDAPAVADDPNVAPEGFDKAARTPTPPETPAPTDPPTERMPIAPTLTPAPTQTPTCPPATPTNTHTSTWSPTPTPTCVIITPTPTPTSTVTPTPTPTVSCSPTASPTRTTPTPAPTQTTPTPTQSNNANGNTSTPKPTLTVTATVTPTRTAPTTPQVAITPSGGAQTGEAPEEEGGPSGLMLVGAGSAMLAGSGMGGVVLVRRRAAHARGRS